MVYFQQLKVCPVLIENRWPATLNAENGRRRRFFFSDEKKEGGAKKEFTTHCAAFAISREILFRFFLSMLRFWFHSIRPGYFIIRCVQQILVINMHITYFFEPMTRHKYQLTSIRIENKHRQIFYSQEGICVAKKTYILTLIKTRLVFKRFAIH